MKCEAKYYAQIIVYIYFPVTVRSVHFLVRTSFASFSTDRNIDETPKMFS